MIKFKQILHESASQAKKNFIDSGKLWYHGTTLYNFELIKKSKFLKPDIENGSDSRYDGIWFTNDLQEAKLYAGTGRNEGVVLAISDDVLSNFDNYTDGGKIMLVKEKIPIKLISKIIKT